VTPQPKQTEPLCAAMTDVPYHVRPSRYHVQDDLMPKEWLNMATAEFSRHRDALTWDHGDGYGDRACWIVRDAREQYPQLCAALIQTLYQAIPDAVKACGIPEFQPTGIEVCQTLYHHGGYFKWHDDMNDHGGNFRIDRRLTFIYYLNRMPKLFSGGDLEFMDGCTIEVQNNRLLMFEPMQVHRVQPVECWSADPLDGRWTITGWIHGDAPKAYTDRLLALRAEKPS
jgi:Rps23 Pro-64 3,4-dihydroxylase Tpa1-like proline 4-hydroxylase